MIHSSSQFAPVNSCLGTSGWPVSGHAVSPQMMSAPSKFYTTTSSLVISYNKIVRIYHFTSSGHPLICAEIVVDAYAILNR